MMNKHTIMEQSMLPKLIVTTCICVCLSSLTHAQFSLDTILTKVNPGRWSVAVERKVSKLESKIIAKSEKTLHRLQKQEEKIYEKQLAAKDSGVAKVKLADIQSKYNDLEQRLKNPAPVIPSEARQYIPHLDTLKTAFKLLNQNSAAANIRGALSKIESLDGKLQRSEEIKNFIRERRNQLKQEFEQLGLTKELKKYNKEVYYYSEQIKEYKQLINDPKKVEKKAIELISKTKLFQDFWRKNSMFSSLFRMPDDPNDPTYLASLGGLQTRAQVNGLIQQQLAAGGPNAQAQFQQNIQQAQSQLQQLKDKFIKAGRGSSDDILPEGFKPNNQRTKSFLKRLEYGTNIQTQKANNLFPVTTDLGLSIGYKINEKSIIGLGASYKLGLGHGWNKIQFSSEGAGLRSYIDWKIPSRFGGAGGGFWISGGYEMNYRTAFSNIARLQNLNAWQQSGLIGLSKIVSVKTKFFKKTKLQLLWDFLSYQQIPKTQTVVFRLGYNF